MSPTLRSLLRAVRASSAGVLLGVYLLGSALHGLHHLQDPACADGTDRSGHACAVCASLHASTLVATAVVVPTTLPVAWTLPAPAPALAIVSRPCLAATPRAPPAS